MADRNFAVNMVIGARDRASKVLRKLNAGLGRLNNRVTQVGGAIAAYFGAQAVANFFRGAVSSAADFEQQLDRIGAVTGATGDEMDQLRAVAEEMGSTTKFTATEAAQGLEILGRAGLSAAESVETLPSVLQLAQAAGLELNEAAGIVTDSLGAMGQGVQEAGRFADVLAEGAKLANTDVQSLGRALSYAGVQASQMGMSAEETVGVLDALASAGIRGERAGTALRNILSQIQDPASKARQELRKLGIDTNDLTEVIGGLEQAGPKAQQAILAFGKEAGPAVRTLLQQGQEGIAEYVQSLNDAEGAAEGMAEEATDNLRGALAGLSSAWDSLRRTLVDPLMEPLKQEVRSLAETFRGLTERGVITSLGESLRDIFQTSVANVKAFIREMGGVKGVMRELDTFVGNATQSYVSFSKQVGIVTAGVRVLWNVFTGIAKTISVVLVGSFAQLSKVIQGAAFGLEKLGIISKQSYEAIKLNADAAVAATEATFDSLKQDVIDIGDTFGLAGEKAKGFGDKVNEGLERARATAAKWKQIADDAQSRWENMKRPVKEVNQAYLDFAASIRDADTQSALTTLEGALKKAADQGDITRQQFKHLSETLQEQFENLEGQTKESGDLISKTLEEMGVDTERLASGMTTAGKKAVDAFQSIASRSDATAEQISAAFRKAAEDIQTEAGVKALREAVQQAVEQNKIAAEDAQQVLAGIVTETEEAANKAAEKAERRARELAEQYEREFQNIRHSISGANTRAAIADLKAQLRQMFLEGKIGAEQLDQGMAAIDERLDELRGTANETIDSMAEFATALDAAKTIDELQSLKGELKDAWEAGRIELEDYQRAVEEVDAKLAELGATAGEVARDFTSFESGMERIRGLAQGMAGSINATHEAIRQLGAKAYETFQRKLGRSTQDAGDRVQRLREEVNRLRDAYADSKASSSFTESVNRVSLAAAETRLRFAQAEQAAASWQRKLKEGNYGVELLEANAEDAARSVSILGRQRMTQLADSIRQAQNELRRLREQADKTLQSVQSDLLSARGEYVELAKRRIEARRSRIRDQLDAAKERDDTEAVKDLRQALKELEELERIRVQEAKQRLEQEKKRRQEDQQRRRDEQRGDTTPRERKVIELQLNGESVEFEGTAREADRLENLLTQIGIDSMRAQ